MSKETNIERGNRAHRDYPSYIRELRAKHTQEDVESIEWKCRKPFENPKLEAIARVIDTSYQMTVMEFHAKTLTGTKEDHDGFMQRLRERYNAIEAMIEHCGEPRGPDWGAMMEQQASFVDLILKLGIDEDDLYSSPEPEEKPVAMSEERFEEIQSLVKMALPDSIAGLELREAMEEVVRLREQLAIWMKEYGKKRSNV
jgi:hypothetical protein